MHSNPQRPITDAPLLLRQNLTTLPLRGEDCACCQDTFVGAQEWLEQEVPTVARPRVLEYATGTADE